MKKRGWVWLGIACTLLGASFCSSGGGTTTPPPDTPKDSPSFSADVQTVFTRSCALSACHDAASHQAGQVLVAGQAYGNIVNVTCTSEPPKLRVKPADADNSYMVIKLEGRQSVGARMPLTGSITATELQNIKNWINKGAQNN